MIRGRMRYAEKGMNVTPYSTRSMNRDLLDRMRALKLYMNASIEAILNEALDLGLNELEELHIHGKKEGRKRG